MVFSTAIMEVEYPILSILPLTDDISTLRGRFSCPISYGSQLYPSIKGRIYFYPGLYFS